MNEGNHSGRSLVLALVSLLVLTGLTFGLHFAPLGGPLGIAVALVIAAVKVSIVGAIFMELRGSAGALRVVIAVSIGFVALLCLGVIGDIALR